MSQKTYKLVTIADLFEQIPLDRVDQCLSELAGMIKYHKQLDSCLSQLAKTEVRTNLAAGVTWTDDGRRDIRLEFESKGYETDANDTVR